MNQRQLGALAVLALVACSGGHRSGDASAPAARVPVQVAAPRFEPIATRVELSGTLAPVESVDVGAATGGRISGLFVRVGDVVSAGQALAQIDAASYAAGLTQARAGASAAMAQERAGSADVAAAASAVASSRAQLDAARAKEQLTARTAARMTELFAQGAISAQQHDESQADLAAARSMVAAADATVASAASRLTAVRQQAAASVASAAQAQAGVDAAGVPLADATIRAPFAGTIVAKFVAPGAVVSAGAPVVALQNVDALELEAAVPDAAAGAVRAGEALAVDVDAAGMTVAGRVRAIVPAATAALRSQLVKIAIPARAGLAPGMFARVSLPARGRATWVVPLDALVTRAEQRGVFLIASGTAVFQPVETGTVGANAVELIGFDGRGKRVAVSGLEALDDGTPVAIRR